MSCRCHAGAIQKVNFSAPIFFVFLEKGRDIIHVLDFDLTNRILNICEGNSTKVEFCNPDRTADYFKI